MYNDLQFLEGRHTKLAVHIFLTALPGHFLPKKAIRVFREKKAIKEIRETKAIKVTLELMDFQ